MFLHSPIIDIIMLGCCLYLFNVFILVNEMANEDVKLLASHSKLWLRFIVWLLVLLGSLYMLLSDIDILCGEYYNLVVFFLLLVLYLVGVFGAFVSYKYGPKDYESKLKDQLQIEALICLPIVFLFMYLF